jgi:GAF domain-containing protein
MLKDDDVVGAIVIYRQEVRRFDDRAIALIKDFAAQAVIAIENARLLNELRQSLEQQTATAEVLSVISSSLGELQPVFQAVLENATRLCEAKFGTLYFREAEDFRAVAMHGAPPAYLKRLGSLLQPTQLSALGQVVRSKQVVHIEDVTTDPAYFERDPIRVSSVEEGGVRTLLGVPMMKENEVIGAIGIYRETVHPFTDRHIALVTNFAAQAVIAIENTRLLNELRQRTTDLTERTVELTEALEQQTATSDVLQVISSYPGDLEPVFATMLEKAVRIRGANFGTIYRWTDDALDVVATHNAPIAYDKARRRSAVKPTQGSPMDRLLTTKKVVHVPDCAAEPSYAEGRNPGLVVAVEQGKVRTALFVPMLKENALIGVFTLLRHEVRPFDQRQVELAKNFAAQAVIAIENARLLKELRERTEQVEAQSQELVVLNQQLEQRVTDQVGEIERMSRLRRFLPPQVADLIVASGSEKQLESHRREITALFCDLRGWLARAGTSVCDLPLSRSI